jgi:hypothetical protein
VLATSKIGLASTLVNSAADEDRSLLPRSGRYVRRSTKEFVHKC